MTEEQEREAFEAWYAPDATRQGVPMVPAEIKALREGSGYGAHRVMINGKWEGWQARASLAKPQPVGGALTEIIGDLRALYAESTAGDWQKGISTHHTVSFVDGKRPYPIAEFHHARDAEFCDAARKHMPALLDALATLSAPVAQPGEADELSSKALTIIAACRDAFPIPPPGSDAEEYWAQSIGDPESVPDYLRALARDAVAGSVQLIESVFEQWWLKSAPAAEFYRMLRAALSQGDVSGEGEGA
jgi:hypothetical protein